MIMNRPREIFLKHGKVFLCSVLLLLTLGQPAWSAISHVDSVSAVTSGKATSLPLAFPAGLVADDILIAQIAVRDDLIITAPSGWNLINRSNNGSLLTQAVYWKRAGASNPVSETWGFSGNDRAAGAMAAYRGVDPVVPVNVSSVRINANSTNVTAGSVTPSVAGTRLVGLYGLADGRASFNPPAGMVEREDIATGSGPTGVAVELADEIYFGGVAATGSRVVLSSDAGESIAHLIALQPALMANFRMDELTWSGTSGEVGDSSGRGYHATATNGALTGSATPAIVGSPGSCNYGVFDGVNDYVAIPTSFPNLITDFTITAWIRTTNNAKSGQRIFIDDQDNTGGYGFSLGDGGAGRLRFYARSTSLISLDTANVIQNNTWYFVAAVMNAVAKTKSIYVFN